MGLSGLVAVQKAQEAAQVQAGTLLTESERHVLRRSIDRRGVSTVAAEIGISREAATRAAAGMLVRRGTTMCVRAWLAESPREAP